MQQTWVDRILVGITVVLFLGIVWTPQDPWSKVTRQLRQATDRSSNQTSSPSDYKPPLERLYVSLDRIKICLDETGCKPLQTETLLCSTTKSFWIAALVLTLIALLDMGLHLVCPKCRERSYMSISKCRCFPWGVGHLLCGCESKLMWSATLVWIASLILVVNMAEWLTRCSERVAPAATYLLIAQHTLPAHTAMLVLSILALILVTSYILHGSHLCCRSAYEKNPYQHVTILPTTVLRSSSSSRPTTSQVEIAKPASQDDPDGLEAALAEI